MHTEVLVFLLIIILVVLVIALVYATRATIGIQSATSDPNISTAYWYLAWTISILWIVIIGATIGVISLFAFGPELIPTFGKGLLYFGVAALAIALVVVGVMASIGAFYIGRSAVESSVADAYRNAVISAATAIGSIVIFIIIAFVVWHYSTPTPLPSPGEMSNEL